MFKNKIVAALSVFVVACAMFIGASSASAQLLIGGGAYRDGLSFEEGGESYSSNGGVNIMVGYSLLPSMLLIPSVEVGFEADSFSGSKMSVNGTSFFGEIGFGVSFLEIYARYAAGKAKITSPDGGTREVGFVKQRTGVELGLYVVNFFYEWGEISFGEFSDSPTLLGIKVRVMFGGPSTPASSLDKRQTELSHGRFSL